MSNHELPRVEIKTPTEQAVKQLALAYKLATLFAKKPEGTETPLQFAVGLANPAIYFNREFEKLPLTFQEKWKKMSEDYAIKAKTIAKVGHTWDGGASGLESMHNLIANGGVNPNYRLVVLSSIVDSSKLYAESTAFVSDEAEFYEENILEMQAFTSRSFVVAKIVI